METKTSLRNERDFSILIVEDDKNDYFFIKELITEHLGTKCVIDLAVSANGAMELLTDKSNHYDLLITDCLLMGASNGLELISFIREWEERENTENTIKIIYHSFFNDITIIRAYENLIDYCIPKSYDSEYLIVVIKYIYDNS